MLMILKVGAISDSADDSVSIGSANSSRSSLNRTKGSSEIVDMSMDLEDLDGM